MQALKGLSTTHAFLLRKKAGNAGGGPEVLPYLRVRDLVSGIAEIAGELDDQGRHLRAMIEAEPACVQVLDLSGNLLEINAAGLRAIEADSFEDVRGAGVLDVVYPDWKAAYEEMHLAVMGG